MKKCLKLILACLACSMLLAGCSNNQKPTDTPTETSKPKETEATVKKVEYERGTLTDKSYESAFLNLKFEAPSNYVMMTQDELDKILDFGSEIAYKDVDKKILDYAKAITVYEMQAVCSDSVGNFPNVSIGMEKLALKNITETQYLDAVKSQLEGVTQIDYTLEDSYGTMAIAGQDYTTLVATTSVAGLNLKQTYLVRKNDDRLVFFILTENADEPQALQDLLNSFQPLN